VVVLAAALESEGAPSYFRCYDSGDLTVPEDALTWLGLADRMPRMRLWLPTRNWILPEFDSALAALNAHPRIIVRPSAMCFGDKSPEVSGLSAGTTSPDDNKMLGAGLADYTCPGGCGACRVCWDRPELSVEYHRK